MIIVVDDENRENEGDLLMAADMVTPAHVNFMISKGKGLLCVPMTAEYAQRLDIPLMTSKNNERHGTKFTVSVDVIDGTSTGISATERARTVKALADPQSQLLLHASRACVSPYLRKRRCPQAGRSHRGSCGSCQDGRAKSSWRDLRDYPR
jgi:3,4-dihydroxy 2-butanone 4-phosphate synthase/GTP cyclohydrolase II